MGMTQIERIDRKYKKMGGWAGLVAIFSSDMNEEEKVAIARKKYNASDRQVRRWKNDIYRPLQGTKA